MNKFDRSNYPSTEPKELVAGELWTWQKPGLANTYDPALYSLAYSFLSLEGKGNFQVETIELADNYIIESTQTDISSGAFKWIAKITQTSSGNVITVESGVCRVRAHETEDARSHTLKTLQAIRATIEKTATKEQQSYSIEGRALGRRTLEELESMERRYSRRWNEEQRRMNRKNGRVTKTNKTLVQFK